MKESVKNVLMPLLQPETSFFELTRSVHINTCSDEIPELAFDVLVPRADVAAVTMPVLDRPSERVSQIRQAFVESQDDRAMRLR